MAQLSTDGTEQPARVLGASVLPASDTLATGSAAPHSREPGTEGSLD